MKTEQAIKLHDFMQNTRADSWARFLNMKVQKSPVTSKNDVILKIKTGRVDVYAGLCYLYYRNDPVVFCHLSF